jgi:hypothetical protein
MGVTLIGVLDIIAGLIFLFAGIALLAVIPIISSSPERFGTNSSSLPFQLLSGTLGYAIAGATIALGIADTIIGIGLLKGKQWAWKIAVALAFISIAGDIITLVLQSNFLLANNSSPVGSIIGIIIDGVILYYLYRPHVKVYFGKSAGPTPL